MVNIKLTIALFLTIFEEVIAFMVANTMMGGFIKPNFDNIAASDPSLALFYTPGTVNMILADFYIAMFIVLATPFIFYLVYTLKKEQKPTSTEYQYQYYGDSYGG